MIHIQKSTANITILTKELIQMLFIHVQCKIPEGNETFALQLSAPQGGALPGIPMVATIVIQENDHPVEFVGNVTFVMFCM